MFISGFKFEADIFLNPLSINLNKLTLERYRCLFNDIPVFYNFLASFLSAFVPTLVTLFTTSLAGFAFCKYNFPGKKILFLFIISTMFIPAQLIYVSLFVMMSRLGWINTYQGLIIPFIAPAFGVFFMRQFMMSFPDEILEAARIDGLSEFGIYWRIVLPIIKPALGAFGALYFMQRWNDYLWPLLVSSDKEMMTIMVSLPSITDAAAMRTPWGEVMAGCSLAILPLLIIFLLGQKYFISGLTIGYSK